MQAYHKIKIGSLIMALWAVAVMPVAADVVTFREGLNGYTGAEDTWLGNFSHPTVGWSNSNFGASTSLGIGDGSTTGTDIRRPIIRFDVSSLPVNAPIVSATLTLREIFDGPSSGDFAFSVYQIADANASWIEGTGSNTGTAQTGAPSWNNRAHPSTPWAGSAGLSTAGTDYLATPVGSGLFTRNDNVMNSISISLTPSLIGYWRTNVNAGLLIFSDVEANGSFQHNNSFASSEDVTGSFRPTLTVEFIPEPSAAMLLGIGVVFLARARNRMQ